MLFQKNFLTDGAQYFVSTDVPDWCRVRNVKQYHTPAYSHDYNGLVERFNRALMERLRRLNLETRLPWIQLVDRVVNVTQQSPHSCFAIFSQIGMGGITFDLGSGFIQVEGGG